MYPILWNTNKNGIKNELKLYFSPSALSNLSNFDISGKYVAIVKTAKNTNSPTFHNTLIFAAMKKLIAAARL